MNAAEDDELGLFLRGGVAGQLKAVAREIREFDHGILLIVMPKDQQPAAKPILCRADSNSQIIIR